MERQDNVALRCLDHRAAAQSRARQIDAVIGQTGRSGREQRVKIGHFLALQALRDRAGLQNLNRAVLCLVCDIMDDLGRVAGRNGVRHADHRRVAACRSRSRAGQYILLLRLAGVAEMDMTVHKAGRNGQSCRIKDLAVRRGVDFFRDLCDHAVVPDQHIKLRVRSRPWIEHAAILDK